MINSYAGNRYTDGEEDKGMQDVEDYSSDYYENQAGDVISNSTNHRRRARRNKTNLALIVITVGVLLVVMGAAVALLGGGESNATSRGSGSDNSPRLDGNENMNSPTRAPTLSSTTLGPTHESIEDFITTLVGAQALQDPNSLASQALRWLEATHDVDRFGNMRLQQRFALACLYLSTSTPGWKKKEGWFTGVDECTWYGVECKNHKLIALNLTDNGLEGLVPMEIEFLKDHLLALELANNDLANQGDELAWMGELTNLRMLDIEQTMFAYDGVPPYISKLKELKILDIAETLFQGDLDGSIFAPLEHLMYLEMGGNVYNSTLPLEVVTLPNLEALYLYDAGLSGNVEFLAHMPKIVELWLDGNDLEGTLPSGVDSLSKLASFSVTNCDLTGQIPSQFGQLSELEQAWFYGNWFSGTIPSEFANLPKLQILGLEDNNITNVAMPDGLCDKGMLSLSSDCGGDNDLVDCPCCTCCEAPCPMVNLPRTNARFLQIQEEIRRL